MKFAVVVLVLLTSPALACRYDPDCYLGSKCVKPPGSIFGVCAGGPHPGNRYDRDPARDTTGFMNTTGKTCRLDFNCGPRAKCLKSKGMFEGVCAVFR